MRTSLPWLVASRIITLRAIHTFEQTVEYRIHKLWEE